MGVSKNSGTPQIINFNRVFHYKPSILGYPYFWKHPYRYKVKAPGKNGININVQPVLGRDRTPSIVAVAYQGTGNSNVQAHGKHISNQLYSP